MKKFLFLIPILLGAFAIEAESPHHVIVEDQSHLSIETPALSMRTTRKIRLENNLTALLISDPETPQSGAAVAVGVGSWDDPQDRPGMAHFVEHLLFLGTEKYPEEEGYSRYLDEHGGTQNAFTMSDRTVFMFACNNSGFLEAFDRFGHFFVSPLFTPSGVDRECKAIHQEFCKDVPLDPWRVLYVKKELANVNHPFHSFCIGNRDTLANISQDELKAWYSEHYSANLMHLVVCSSLDIDLLEKEVLTIFSQVKNKEKVTANCAEPILCSHLIGKMVAVAPLQGLQTLELSWELPRFYGEDRQVHADKIISHILGHEGSTSLLAQLKREQLAESLGVSTHRAGKNQCILSLSVKLTSKGIQEYKSVIKRCFEAIASLKMTGIPRFLFDELVQLEELNYRFQPRKEIFNFVTDYAMRLMDEPLETFPRESLIPSLYAPDKIQDLLQFLSPFNCQYTLIAPPNLSRITPTNKERWMGVDYATLALSPNQLDKWAKATPHPAICIPRPNPFIPTNLKVFDRKEQEEILPTPHKIVDAPNGQIYLSRDDRYSLPEVIFTFTIKTPAISNKNPKSQLFADIFVHAVEENLNTVSYEAMIAGLDYSLTPKHNGIELKLAGFSEKAIDFLSMILKTIQDTEPTQQQFTLAKELLERDYHNTANASSIKQGGENLWGILYQNYCGPNEKASKIKGATYEQMLLFSKDVFRKSYIEGMLYGDISEKEALEVWEKISALSSHEAYPASSHEKIALAHFSDKEPTIVSFTSDQPAHAVILALDCGDFTFKKRAAQELLVKGLEEPFFSELRTRQQTAYLVTNWSQELERHLYCFFAIQSSSHDTRDLLARFELFLETSVQHLSESVITKERFEITRQSLINKLEHPAENILKMGGLLSSLAFDYEADFAWVDKKIEALKELTYEEFISYVHEFLGKNNKKRLALCVNGKLPNQGGISYRQLPNVKTVRKEISYKTRLLDIVD